MADLTYSTGGLVQVVENVTTPARHFLNRYFRLFQQSTDERIYFDARDGKRRIAPYVSPLVEGKIVEPAGFRTDSFAPPYLKPKTPINPNRQFTRRFGERFGGELSPQQRRDAAVVDALRDHREMIEMREEQQAAEALRTGKITVAGKGYETMVIDFGRDPQLTVALAGAALWSAGTATPLSDIEGWSLLTKNVSNGAVLTEVTMAPDAWGAFKDRLSDVDRQILFNSLRGSDAEVEMGPRAPEQSQYMGRIGSFLFFVYSDGYVDENGDVQDVMPSGTVVMTGSALLGTRAYAAIRDPRAGFRALPRFPKVWIGEDPPMEWAMTQSAPLMVPYRPNASFSATVL